MQLMEWLEASWIFIGVNKTGAPECSWSTGQ